MGIDPVSARTLGPIAAVSDPAAPKSAPSETASPAETIVPQVRAIQVDASYGEDNRIIYRILDKQSGDLIQQIPPEQLLAIARSIQQLLQAEREARRLDLSM
jgi:uncharacterized FlaG/YvyC family protein